MVMDRTAVSLGGVTFDYPLFVKEYDSPTYDKMATMRMSAARTHIVYVADVVTPYITLESRDDGWMSQPVVDALKALISNIGAEYQLVYDDGTSDTVRVAHEARIQFTPLFDCSLEYTSTITLAKTNT